MLRFIVVIILALSVSACASSSRLNRGADSYAYAGEQYGQIEVALSDDIRNDAAKAARAEQLDLKRKIRSYLVANRAFDESAANKLEVVVNSIHIRNAFNAVMFGFMSGRDNVEGTVTLKDDTGLQKSSFNISASYALGGVAGGQDGARLGWLGDKFAELTANMVVGKQ